MCGFGEEMSWYFVAVEERQGEAVSRAGQWRMRKWCPRFDVATEMEKETKREWSLYCVWE